MKNLSFLVFAIILIVSTTACHKQKEKGIKERKEAINIILDRVEVQDCHLLYEQRYCYEIELFLAVSFQFHGKIRDLRIELTNESNEKIATAYIQQEIRSIIDNLMFKFKDDEVFVKPYDKLTKIQKENWEKFNYLLDLKIKVNSILENFVNQYGKVKFI